MQLLVGLGNPGALHAGQRHNIGFMAVDAIAAVHGLGPWKARFQGHVAEGLIDGRKVLLLKPQTYMNESGRSVGEVMRFFRLGPEALTVFYDELDLAPGRLRVKRGGGAAGHNGIRSIDAHVGPDYRRVRLGIGHPGHRERVTGHVLGNFAKADEEWLVELLGAVAAEVPMLLAGDEQRFLQEVARRMEPLK